MGAITEKFVLDQLKKAQGETNERLDRLASLLQETNRLLERLASA
jgi:hypothetical protein